MMKIYLIRHSMTEGNLRKRYVGTTDEELCREGVELLKDRTYPRVQRIYASPLRRCLQTARLIYPGQEVIPVAELAECDFGQFENKNYQELLSVPEYQRWIDSGGTLPFPGGESREEFVRRSLCGFRRSVMACRESGIRTAAFVVHGGTIMSIMERYAYPRGDYFDYQIGNGEGYELIVTDITVESMPDTGTAGGSGLFAGSAAGRSALAVSSGPSDREPDLLSGTNYSKLFS